MTRYSFIPLPHYIEYPQNEMIQKSRDFYRLMKRRRTIRDFSDREVPVEIIENCIKTAGTAPNGANMQPWHFVVVSDPEIKKQIRVEAEKVEHDFYHKKAPQYWLDALAPLGTDENKAYLETAPYLIVVFSVRHSYGPDGEKRHHYYLPESTGIAAGLLITALHNAGLATLTHTPQPMSFLRTVLDRPKEENPFIMIVTGYPAQNAKVPDITKKKLNEICTFK